MNGLYFNIQRFSIHDGPGIRTTIFLKGCPLKCSWCHNPEGISPVPEMEFLSSRCIECNGCAEICSNTGPGSRIADWRECDLCGGCAEFCPVNARRRVGETITVSELIERIERDRTFHERSGGGVTFSGGEPLLQGEFLLACLSACRDKAIHTAVDTSGYADEDLMLRVAELSDLLLYDIKFVDDRSHILFTGVSVEPILRNLEALQTAATEIWIRIPLIPGVNDGIESLRRIGTKLAGIRNISRICLLPYHSLGSMKYRHHLKEGDFQEIFPALSCEALEEATAILESYGLTIEWRREAIE